MTFCSTRVRKIKKMLPCDFINSHVVVCLAFDTHSCIFLRIRILSTGVTLEGGVALDILWEKHFYVFAVFVSDQMRDGNFFRCVKRVFRCAAILCKCFQSGTFFINGSAQMGHLFIRSSGSDIVVDCRFKLIIGTNEDQQSEPWWYAIPLHLPFLIALDIKSEQSSTILCICWLIPGQMRVSLAQDLINYIC